MQPLLRLTGDMYDVTWLEFKESIVFFASGTQIDLFVAMIDNLSARVNIVCCEITRWEKRHSGQLRIHFSCIYWEYGSNCSFTFSSRWLQIQQKLKL